MHIKEIFQQKKPVLSFEIFPPKPDYPLETVFETLAGLRDLNPDFISVTYGAGGSNRARTVQIAARVKRDFQIETLAHLTCVGHSPTELDQIIAELHQNGIENILALRGDPPRDKPDAFNQPGHFCHAAQLVDHLQKSNRFCIGGAAYPEGHADCRRLDDEWFFLREKVERGVSFFISQLFFDNRVFYHFKESLLRLGVTVPVAAGIMPVFNSKQIRRMVYLSGASIPGKLLRLLDQYDNDPVALEQAGLEYAIDQINDLVANGVEGIHLCTMNRVEQTRMIVESIRNKFGKTGKI